MTEQTLSPDDQKELIEKAKKDYEACSTFWTPIFEDALTDKDFTRGIGQWPAGVLAQRKRDNQPCLVLNQCLPYANQITNDIKQARLAIRVVPVDDKSDIETAEIRAGIIRNIEKQSDSKNVYGTAASDAVHGGIGWMRVTTDFADDETFDVEAYLKRVLDLTSVMIDPDFMEVNGADADYGFVDLTYTQDKFAELYPDATPSSFAAIKSSKNGDGDDVQLVEYYYKEHEKDTLTEVALGDKTEMLNGEQLKQLEDLQDAMVEDYNAAGERGDFSAPEPFTFEIKRSRDIDVYTIYHCILSGDEVLQREVFPSQFIPLVPVIGEEFFTDGKREFHSLIRQGKDAQMMYNYYKSTNTAQAALAPKAPFVGTVGQFQTHGQKWANANTQNYAYLEYDMVMSEDGVPAPPPMRQPPPQISPSMMQEANSARDDIRLALGIPQSNMGERSNVVSGIAVQKQQIQGDNATFHFIDHLASSIAQVGRILNDLILELYNERKIARIIGEDGAEEVVPVNEEYTKGEGENAKQVTHDLGVGKYDIDMDVGASYSSKRQETADKLTELIASNPAIGEVTMDLVFDALDLPMGKEIAERIRSQMPPEILGDDPQAAKLKQAAQMIQQLQEQMANMDAALQDKKKNEDFSNAVTAEKAQLDRDAFEVNAEKTKADIAKIYSEIQNTDADTKAQSIANIDSIMGDVNDIREAVEMLIGDMEGDIDEVEVLIAPDTSDAMLSEEISE